MPLRVTPRQRRNQLRREEWNKLARSRCRPFYSTEQLAQIAAMQMDGFDNASPEVRQAARELNCTPGQAAAHLREGNYLP